MTDEPSRQADDASEDQAVLRAVERFALLLSEMGLQRMAARVFAYVLIDDAERYTAQELAEGLRVSPAAISGAVRTLVTVGLLGKEREPGSRSDQYRIYDDDIWRAIMLGRTGAMDQLHTYIDGICEILGPHKPGQRRLRESQEFIAFMNAEVPAMLDRWSEHRAQKFGPGGR